MLKLTLVAVYIAMATTGEVLQEHKLACPIWGLFTPPLKYLMLVAHLLYLMSAFSMASVSRRACRSKLYWRVANTGFEACFHLLCDRRWLAENTAVEDVISHIFL